MFYWGHRDEHPDISLFLYNTWLYLETSQGWHTAAPQMFQDLFLNTLFLFSYVRNGHDTLLTLYNDHKAFITWFTAIREAKHWFQMTSSDLWWPSMSQELGKAPRVLPSEVWGMLCYRCSSPEVMTRPKWAKDCSATSCLEAIVCLSEFFPPKSQHQLFLSSPWAVGFKSFCVLSILSFFF